MPINSAQDSDAYFVIDPLTRNIRNVSGKTILVNHDHNSERFTFEIPRSVDDHDISQCNKVEIHYINVSATGESSRDVYRVEDLGLAENDDETVLLSWLISDNATKYVGNLSFVIRFSFVEGSERTYLWSTAVHSGINVVASIDNSEAILSGSIPDILQQWYNEFLLADVAGKNSVDVYVEEEVKPLIDEYIDDAKENIVDYVEKIASDHTLAAMSAMPFAIGRGKSVFGKTVNIPGPAAELPIRLATYTDLADKNDAMNDVDDDSAIVIRQLGKNILPYPYDEMEDDHFSATGHPRDTAKMTVLEDGGIELKGDSVTTKDLGIVIHEGPPLALSGTVTLSLTVKKNGENTTDFEGSYLRIYFYRHFNKASSAGHILVQNRSSVSFDAAEYADYPLWRIEFINPMTATVDNPVSYNHVGYVQLEIGETATEYEKPYSTIKTLPIKEIFKEDELELNYDTIEPLGRYTKDDVIQIYIAREKSWKDGGTGSLKLKCSHVNDIDVNTFTDATEYADAADAVVLTSAKRYTDSIGEDTLASAKEYTEARVEDGFLNIAPAAKTGKVIEIHDKDTFSAPVEITVDVDGELKGEEYVIVENVGKNLLPYQFTKLDERKSEVYCTRNRDSSITLEGTARSDRSAAFTIYSGAPLIKSGKVTASIKGEGNIVPKAIQFKTGFWGDFSRTSSLKKGQVMVNPGGVSVTFDASDYADCPRWDIELVVPASTRVDGTFYPQFEFGETDTAYEAPNATLLTEYVSRVINNENPVVVANLTFVDIDEFLRVRVDKAYPSEVVNGIQTTLTTAYRVGIATYVEEKLREVAPIDHSHTLESIGAAAADHKHTPESIGAVAQTNGTMSGKLVIAGDQPRVSLSTPNGLGLVEQTPETLRIENHDPIDYYSRYTSIELNREIDSDSDLVVLKHQTRDGLRTYKLYGEHNKPNLSDMGVLSKAGDTMTGDLEIKKASLPAVLLSHTGRGNASFSLDGETVNIGSKKLDGVTHSTIALTAGATKEDAVKLKVHNDSTMRTVEYKLYGEHNKPTPEDIGAAPDGHTHPAILDDAMTYTDTKVTEAMTYTDSTVGAITPESIGALSSVDGQYLSFLKAIKDGIYAGGSLGLNYEYCSQTLPSTGLDEWYEITGLGDCKDEIIDIPARISGIRVEDIRDNAFENNNTIRGVRWATLSERDKGLLMQVGDAAFKNCYALESIESGCNCHIGEEAFYGARSLNSVKFNPKGLLYIGDKAFRMCSNLAEITVPAHTEIGENVFHTSTVVKVDSSNGGNYLLEQDHIIYKGNPVSDKGEIYHVPKADVYARDAIILRDSITTIPVDTFSNTSIYHLCLPKDKDCKVTSLQSGVFSNMSNLNYIMIPRTMYDIALGAFSQSTGVLLEEDGILYLVNSYIDDANNGTSGTYYTVLRMPNTNNLPDKQQFVLKAGTTAISKHAWDGFGGDGHHIIEIPSSIMVLKPDMFDVPSEYTVDLVRYKGNRAEFRSLLGFPLEGALPGGFENEEAVWDDMGFPGQLVIEG